MVARRIWCEHAVVRDEVANGVLVALDDGFVADVEVGVAAPDDAEPLDGLTMPGFANAHSHAFHRALRSRTHRGSGDFWTWREQMYAVAQRLTPANYVALARATFAEMLLAGYTCVGEFHYVHHAPGGEPYDDPNAMGLAIVDAARTTGIRLTLLDACYLRAGTKQPPTHEQLRFSDQSASRWCERVGALAALAANDVDRGEGLLRVGAAIHSVRAVDADSIATVARFAHNHRMPLHAHVSEQVGENEEAALEFGCTPTAILAQQGALSERFTAVHATHLGVDDIDLYAMSRSACCFCPTTERDLADGIGPSAALRGAGVPLCIGSDQHAVIDPFEEMRAIELDERLRAMRRGTHPPSALLECGSANGYRSLGWERPGFDVGSVADLTTIAVDGVRLAGAPIDALLDAAVFAATAGDVTHVIVGGRTRVANRTLVVDGHAVDVAAELRTAIAAVSGGAG